jgi:hypothetical protein
MRIVMRFADVFGTIESMMLFRRRPTGWTFCLLLIVTLTTACASNSDLEPASVIEPSPTPTPFQPQSGSVDSPYDSPLLPQVEPTFTPYPTPVSFAPANLSPVQIVPTNDGISNGAPAELNNPLTGLPPSDPSLLDRRPMAIKIANAPDYIRPQSGLSMADVAFEYYIEWGETRFLAVYYGNDLDRVGPVRSGRFFDEHVARMYHAYLVFKYADPREFDYLKASTLSDFLVVPGNGSCPPFAVGKQKRDTYNNIFFNTIKFADCLAKEGKDNSRQTLRSGFFSDAPVGGALAVNRIFIFYSPQSYGYWNYDAATRKYFRYQEAQDITGNQPETYAPLSDAETGLPVTADNVIVLFVPHLFGNTFDEEDEVYHIDLVDSGQAFVFRDGIAIPALWQRTDADQPLLLTTLEGTPIYLRPGRTFYQVVGETSAYSQNGTDWRFTFGTP